MTGFEPAASCSQSRRATNCATPGYFVFLSGWSYSPKPGAIPTSLYPDIHFSAMIPRRGEKIKVFSVCGHSCGQSHFYAVFCNRGKSCKRMCHKALRHFALPCPGYRHGTPKPPALPAALIPDFWLLSFCARCGQTCGQVVFLTTSTCGGNACIAGVSRDCGHSVFRLEGGATRSQMSRPTS